MDIILKYFKNLSDAQKEQFAALYDLYTDWNSKINVISRKDITNLYEHHVLHSLGIAEVIRFKPGTRVMDLGTGGGFPGIPLAIMFPETQFHLVDSIGKKVKVATEIASAIGLKNVTTRHCRAEEEKAEFDFVVSRAVMPLTDLLKIIRKNISREQQNALPNGLICLKGGELANEVMPVKNQTEIYDLKNYFEEEFFETKKVVYVTVNKLFIRIHDTMKIKRFEFNMFPVNCYVLSDETNEAVIIDPGCFYPEECTQLKNYITANNLVPKHLLNTHLHLDHIFGNPFVSREFNLQPEGGQQDEFWIEQAPMQARMFGFTINEQPISLGKYIMDGDIIRFGNTELEAIHVPGHSPGSMVYYCKQEKCMFSGDVLFQGSIGRADLAGGNFEELREGICSRLFCLPNDTTVYPGHGGMTTIGAEKLENPFFR